MALFGLRQIFDLDQLPFYLRNRREKPVAVRLT
jgi:hypothetical protein